MYLIRILTAIFNPRVLSSRIACTHEGCTHSRLIDVGMDKMWWCSACGATWFSASGAAA